MNRKLIALTVGLLLGATGCDVSKGELERLARAAQPCRPGDTCTVLPATDCTCDFAVNARHIEGLQSRAKRVDCEGATVTCAPRTGEPRCVEDRCAFAR